MVSVEQVAKYILKEKGSMTTMKLQKLVYYCQAWSLTWDEAPLFDDEFEAWANGPVCPKLFNYHKGLFVVKPSILKDVPTGKFTSIQLETIKSVLNYYGDMEPHWLIELTHKEKPWKEARKDCKPGESCSNIIPKTVMQDYYSSIQQ